MAAVRRLPATVSVVEAVRRAVRLRCPRCGEGELFSGWFAMHQHCPRCDLRFEREQGYFVGAIYVNYAVTAVTCLGTAIGLDLAFGVALGVQLGVAIALALLVPLLFFRYSRSLWLAIDHRVTAADEATERRRRRRR